MFRKRTGVGRGSDAERAGHLVLPLFLELADDRGDLFMTLAEEVFELAPRRALRRRQHTAGQEALGRAAAYAGVIKGLFEEAS